MSVAPPARDGIEEARDAVRHDVRGVEEAEELDQRGDETRPARLMAGAQAGAVVAEEVLVEQDQVAPVGIGLELSGASVHGPSALLVTQEQTREPLGDLSRHLEQGYALAGAGWTLHGEVVAVEGVEIQEPADEQHVHREPDGATPIGVAAEETARGFGRLVVDAIDVATHRERVRVVPVIARERADAERAQELVLVEHV